MSRNILSDSHLPADMVYHHKGAHTLYHLSLSHSENLEERSLSLQRTRRTLADGAFGDGYISS